MFVVVRRKILGKNLFKAIPESFVVEDEAGEQTVWWPKKDIERKIKDPTCIPDCDSDDWVKGEEVPVMRHFDNWLDANAAAERLSNYRNMKPNTTTVTVPRFQIPSNLLVNRTIPPVNNSPVPVPVYVLNQPFGITSSTQKNVNIDQNTANVSYQTKNIE